MAAERTKRRSDRRSVEERRHSDRPAGMQAMDARLYERIRRAIGELARPSAEPPAVRR